MSRPLLACADALVVRHPVRLRGAPAGWLWATCLLETRDARLLRECPGKSVDELLDHGDAGCVVGVHLRDHQPAEARRSREDPYGGKRVGERETLIALVGVVGDGEVDEVEHVDVEVHDEAGVRPLKPVNHRARRRLGMAGDVGERDEAFGVSERMACGAFSTPGEWAPAALGTPMML